MPDLTPAQVHASSKWKELSRLARARQPFCSACGDDDEDELQADHIVPLDQGGAPYDGRNIDVLCATCNGRKGGTWHAADATTAGNGGLIPVAVPAPSIKPPEGPRPSLSPYRPPYQKPTTINRVKS